MIKFASMKESGNPAETQGFGHGSGQVPGKDAEKEGAEWSTK
jgi:hypothetical protein